MTDNLKPCPFCGGEANGDGYIRYSSPIADTKWSDGSEIIEAFFVNCIKCGIDNGRPGLVGGYQTKAEAVARWNTRSDQPVSVEARNGVEAVAEALLSAFLAGRGSTRKPRENLPTMDTWRSLAESVLSKSLPTPPEVE